MLKYGYTIGWSWYGGERRSGHCWIIPFAVDFEEVVEHVIAGGVRLC